MWRGRTLRAPRGFDVRPTTDRVREAIFSILGERVEGTKVLDLFAGTGAMAIEAQRKGAGVATAEFLRGTRVVRAFNCIPAASLADQPNRQPARLAIPIGGDDEEALEVAQRLVSDAGFDPVLVGSLAQTRQFDLGQPLAAGDLTAEQLRARIAGR